MLRLLWVTGGILFFAGGISAPNLPFARGQQPPELTVSIGEVVTDESIQSGLRLEQQRLWLDAIQHYESATRQHPDDASLKQRLLVCRIHHDVQRRYRTRHSYDRSAR